MARLLRRLVVGLLILASTSTLGWAQEFSTLDRTRGVQMLRGMRRYLKDMYYDTSFHGVDVDTRFRLAEDRIHIATSNGEIFTLIAAVVVDLNDSHTLFIPPQRAARVDYGWEMTAVGDSVFVTAIKRGSPAESSGLHLGDRVVALNGIPMNRDAVWQARYYFELVSPHSSLHVQLDGPDGTTSELDVPATVTQEPQFLNLAASGFRNFIIDWENYRRNIRNRDWVAEGDVLIWRMASFEQEERDIDWMMGRARQHRALVLDVRDNAGGSTVALRRLVSRFFDHRVLVGVEHRRQKVDSMWANPAHASYTGNVVVLINSRSASAAELFARVIQLEGRGLVIGDRSSGAVMVSQSFGELTSGGRGVVYGLSISVADVRVADGASLEHVGTSPDSVVLPTRQDLLTRRDPVLAKAVVLAGGHLEPEEAGKLFPVVWR